MIPTTKLIAGWRSPEARKAHNPATNCVSIRTSRGQTRGPQGGSVSGARHESCAPRDTFHSHIPRGCIATLRKLTKPVGHPWSNPPRRIRVALFCCVGSPLTAHDRHATGFMGNVCASRAVDPSPRTNPTPLGLIAKQDGTTAREKYPRGVWYGSQGPQREGIGLPLRRHAVAVFSTRLTFIPSEPRKLAHGPRPVAGVIGRSSVCARRLPDWHTPADPDAVNGRRVAVAPATFSSGDGPGIHKPRSRLGRARDRAKCPVVTRFKFRHRLFKGLVRCGEAGPLVTLGCSDAGNLSRGAA